MRSFDEFVKVAFVYADGRPRQRREELLRRLARQRDQRRASAEQRKRYVSRLVAERPRRQRVAEFMRRYRGEQKRRADEAGLDPAAEREHEKQHNEGNVQIHRYPEHFA